MIADPIALPPVRRAAILALLLSLPGCGDDGAGPATGGGGGMAATTTTGASTAATTTGGGGDPAGCGWAAGAFVEGACSDCMTTACCDVVGACAADPTCGPLLACSSACDHDRDCLAACAADQPQASPAQLAVGECLNGSCQEACPTTCEDFSPPPDARDRAACADCMQSDCCEVLASQATEEFFAWGECSQACVDALCLRECELAHPTGPELASAGVQCIYGDTCGGSCSREPSPADVCGNFEIGNETCAQCARQACCAEDEACGFDVSCINAFVCVLECYDVPSCRACYEAWPAETLGQVLVVDGCVSAGCTEACDSDGCGHAKHLVPAPCGDCTRESCCAEQSACTDDAACAGLLVCATLCDGDAACLADCEGRFPTAVAEHDALRACQAASCAEACAP